MPPPVLPREASILDHRRQPVKYCISFLSSLRSTDGSDRAQFGAVHASVANILLDAGLISLRVQFNCGAVKVSYAGVYRFAGLVVNPVWYYGNPVSSPVSVVVKCAWSLRDNDVDALFFDDSLYFIHVGLGVEGVSVSAEMGFGHWCPVIAVTLLSRITTV